MFYERILSKWLHVSQTYLDHIKSVLSAAYHHTGYIQDHEKDHNDKYSQIGQNLVVHILEYCAEVNHIWGHKHSSPKTAEQITLEHYMSLIIHFWVLKKRE